MPPRKPTAASANRPPETMPRIAGRHEKTSLPARDGHDSTTHADGGDEDRDAEGRG